MTLHATDKLGQGEMIFFACWFVCNFSHWNPTSPVTARKLSCWECYIFQTTHSGIARRKMKWIQLSLLSTVYIPEMVYYLITRGISEKRGSIFLRPCPCTEEIWKRRFHHIFSVLSCRRNLKTQQSPDRSLWDLFSRETRSGKSHDVCIVM